MDGWDGAPSTRLESEHPRVYIVTYSHSAHLISPVTFVIIESNLLSLPQHFATKNVPFARTSTHRFCRASSPRLENTGALTTCVLRPISTQRWHALQRIRKSVAENVGKFQVRPCLRGS